MINISKKDVLSIYRYFKNQALKSYHNNSIERCLELIELSSKIAYQFNYFYKDDELERLLAKIADKISGTGKSKPLILNRYVLIDTNGTDNHGLTQQYIRSMIASGVEFAYVYEDLDLDRIKIILQELKAYPKATIFAFDRPYSFVERIQKINAFISEYNPEKYLMHIMPWDVVAIVICNILKSVNRYNINATDHAFWLGATCIDYCIEFRNYGYTVSLEKRGLKKQQLLLLPYYPLQNESVFKGLPKYSNQELIKIFSGGSFYKIYGSNEAYFLMVRQLLFENPNTVLFYAGTGNDYNFKKFIKKNKLQNRIYLLGNRSDIQEVFKNCDIYLGTYPIGGGLMSQYAAINGKPILAYTNPELSTNFLEGLINHELNLYKTHTSLADFYAHAKRLCENKSLRIAEGNDLKKSVISPSKFNTEFNFIMENNRSERPFKPEKINYSAFSELYLEVENRFGQGFQRLVALKLIFKTIMFPKIFINSIIVVIKKILRLDN